MTGSRLTRREVFPFDTPKGEALRKIFETIPIDLDQLDDVVIVNPQDGDGLVYDEDILAWTNAPVGGGSVESVGLSLPSDVFDVTNSPVTTTGTLTGSFKVQPENTVFAGPASGVDDTPSFRALVPGDIPGLPVGTIKGLASSRLFGIGQFPTGDYGGVSISVGTGFSFSGDTLNLSTNLQGWSGIAPSSKQNTLTAGANITIVGDVISAASGGGGINVEDVCFSLLHNKHPRIFVGGEDGLTAFSANNETASGFSAMSGLIHVTGKFYFEFEIVALGSPGYPRVALSMGTAVNTIDAASSNSGTNVGWGVAADGQKHSGGGSAYGSPGFSAGERGMCAIDASGATASIWFGRLGTWYASGDPVAGLNAAYTGMSKTYGFVPTVTPRGGIVRLYLKAADFSYTPPSGFSAWRS